MKTKFIGIVVVAIVAIVVGATIVGDSNTKHVSKIGVIGVLSGQYGSVGEEVLAGMRLAQSEYNVLNPEHQVEIVAEDDTFDAKVGVSAFQKLTSIDNVDGLINMTTPTMDAIYESSAALPYPVAMVFFQSNNVADDHVFQTTYGNDGVWDGYATYLKQSDAVTKKILLVYQQTDVQKSFADAFEKSYGGTLARYEVSSIEGSALRSDALKIKEMEPTLVIIFMDPVGGALLTKEIKSIAGDTIDFAYDTQIQTGLDSYKKIFGEDLKELEGSYTVVPESAPNEAFVNAFQEKYERAPGFGADFGYDTFMMYVQTAAETENEWKDNLHELDYEGVSGHIKFDEKGIRFPNVTIKQVRGGELVPVKVMPFIF